MSEIRPGFKKYLRKHVKLFRDKPCKKTKLTILYNYIILISTGISKKSIQVINFYDQIFFHVIPGDLFIFEIS